MDFNKDHPRVFFPSNSPGDTKTFGFLFLVDGEAWAAKTLEDAKARFPAIPFPLEPKYLRGLPDTEQGERQFEYLGQVPRRRSTRFSLRFAAIRLGFDRPNPSNAEATTRADVVIKPAPSALKTADPTAPVQSAHLVTICRVWPNHPGTVLV